jgi:NAD(P)-dependent dehydrogenase (short-subunit alcohol dehydrogenase family)
MDRLKGKVALVTGGASGIGERTCRLFAEEGARVVIADINEEAGRKLADDILNSGAEASFIKMDISYEEDWEKTIEQIIGRYGKLNILVNNAGIAIFKRILETSLEEWERTMAINARGTYLGTKHVVDCMKDQDEPCSIINLSSALGQVGDPAAFAYCASKGAVTMLTKAAALDCCENGWPIRINSVHPSVIRTAITEQQIEASDRSEEEVVAELGALNPIGRLGTPMDIAWANLYLASDESSFVTGSEFNVDGGWTAK